MAQHWHRHDHLDEIAGLLAQGYLRLRRKHAVGNTCGQLFPDERDISLDSICQAEPFIGTEQITKQENANGNFAGH
jgi:hypothetical protein